MTRLGGIQKSINRRARDRRADTWYQLQAYTSSPPDTRVHIRPGWLQANIFWADQNTAWFPTATADFANSSQFVNDSDETYTGNFGNANWYMPILLCYSYDYFDSMTDTARTPTTGPLFSTSRATHTEYETAAEAEAGIVAWMESASWPLYDTLDIPLCIVILRNDGTTGISGAVLPIDAVNRGRSYLWRDARMRNTTKYYDGFYS